MIREINKKETQFVIRRKLNMLRDICDSREAQCLQTPKLIGIDPDSKDLAELIEDEYVAMEHMNSKLYIIYLTEKGLHEIGML